MTFSLYKKDHSLETQDENNNNKSSLLVQALEVPNLHLPLDDNSMRVNSNVNHTNINMPRATSPDPFIPRHSDFTVPTSNVGSWTTLNNTTGGGACSFLSSPPDHLEGGGRTTPPMNNRRSILGNKVEQKYVVKYKQSSSSIPPPTSIPPLHPKDHTNHDVDTNNHHHVVFVPATEPPHQTTTTREMSDLTPPSSPSHPYSNSLISSQHLVSPLTPHDAVKKRHSVKLSSETTNLHAQCFLLGLAFLAIWTPQNCMAPNLTSMAQDYGFTEEAQRDFYLGSNLALATGVLSLPLSAGIGILTDVVNRKVLFVLTVVGGAISSYLTARSSGSYQMLFVARLFNGGFMSGSVPVAFSLLGDLFHTHERNAASSGLTAMMGLGIIAGQVYAGIVGSTVLGWSHAFVVSSIFTLMTALLVVFFVQEPIRGGKEQVLQDMLRHGTRYERKLSWQGFIHAMHKNRSNVIIMWQGFFSSVPWGIIFVFLNDYLSQERGFSVVDATFLVLVFGVGCAAGGVLGGYWGQVIQGWNRSWLPLFMAATTFLGVFPFLCLLNSTFENARGFAAIFYSWMGGCIASLPSVNVRPCLLNVNPPETRGAALTAANLIINLARGAGPSCITLMGAIWGVNRQFSFNVTLGFFWTVSAIQLVYLSRSLPIDQDAMETELAKYAKNQIDLANNNNTATNKSIITVEDDGHSIVSIEDRITSFDTQAARETVQFMESAFREIGDEFRHLSKCTAEEVSSSSDSGNNSSSSSDEEGLVEEEENMADIEKKRKMWIRRQQQQQQDFNDDQIPTEQTALVPRRLSDW